MAGSLEKKKIVVIGTGMGGSSVAPLLAKEGADVTVLERNGFPGGKAASFEREGFIYDTGVHWLARGDKGPMGEVAEIVGADVKFKVMDTAMYFTTGGRTIVLSQKMDEDEALEALFEDLGVLEQNRPGARELFKDITTERTPQELAALDGVSFAEYIAKYVDDDMLNLLFDGFTGMYCCISRRSVSAGEFIYCYSTQSKVRNLCYPMGGMRAVPMAYLDALQAMGGELRYSTPVEQILVEGGKVRGVEAGGFIPADIVISNNGAKETVAMTGRHNFPDDYLAKVDTQRLSFGAVSVKYALDTELVKEHLSCYTPDFKDPELAETQAPIFIPVPSAADPGLAPPGCQLVLAGGLAPQGLEDREQADAICKDMLDRIENTMQSLYPDIEDHLVWKIRTDTRYIAEISGRVSGEVIGLAQNRHQVGVNRLANATPVEGLYLVGADAGGRGVGTEMATDSALNLWRSLRDA